MKHFAIVTSILVVTFLLSGGCASTHVTSATMNRQHLARQTSAQHVALATLGPANRAATHTAPATQARAFHLGAGDALGQAIYANYAAIARANAGWQYASGSTTD